MRHSFAGFCLALCLILLLAGCSLLGESETEPPRGKLAFETLVKNDYTFNNTTGEEVTVVLRSEDEEEKFLDRYLFNPPFPKVGYAEDIVIGVITSRRRGGSYEIAIDSIVAQSNVVVYATERGFTDGTRQVSWPSHIVALSRSDVNGRDIKFAVFNRDCMSSPCDWKIE